MTKQIKRSITRFFKGFTLVELIIVIAIIAILSVTAFMTITKWIGESRDSRRLSDIGSIHRALNYNYVDQSTSEKYPLPDEAQTITGENGEILWKQGVFGSTATEETSTLTKIPEDPNGEKYEYSVTEDQETYEVYAKLENGEEISYLTDKAYAQPEKYIAKRGNYNGYIVGNTGSDYKLYNAPSIYLTTGAQLTSGTKEIYQEGEKEDIQVNITGTNISDLYNGSNVEDTLNTISKNYPEITDTTKAQEIVNSAGNSTESIDTSSNDDEGSTTSLLDSCSSQGEIIYGDNDNESDLTCDDDIAVCSGSGTGYVLQACNLGSSNVASSSTDSNAYGHYFQFGRDSSHEDGTWTNGSSSNDYDWESPGGTDDGSANMWGVEESEKTTATFSNQNSTDQSKMQGPCPSGYHVPTQNEWDSIVTAGSWLSNGSNLSSDLKMPYAGYRNRDDASLGDQGSDGYYWSSSPDGDRGYRLSFDSSYISPGYSGYRAVGFSIRCLKDQ